MIIPNFVKSMEKKLEEMKIQGKLEGIIEGKLEAKLEGKLEGIKLAKRVLKLSANGESIQNIAKTCEITVDEVKEILFYL